MAEKKSFESAFLGWVCSLYETTAAYPLPSLVSGAVENGMQKRFHPQLSPALWAASAVTLSPLSPLLSVSSAKAQVVPSADGTGTTVTQNGSSLTIEGGTQTNGNLFHKFDEFNVEASETANFTSDSSVFNIVGQVAGGNPSHIAGQVQVSGSNADLYLVNPAGILFGPDAQLSLSGSFTAASADQVGFGEAWLDVLEEGAAYSQFTAAPSGFRLSAREAGAIVNQADLSVAAGESLTLIGGSVISEGEAVAPGGEVGLVAVGGESTVRFTTPGSLLSLEVVQGEISEDGLAFSPADLPALLTGQAGADATDRASRLSVDSSGTVRLLGTEIESGDVAIAANLSASSSIGHGGTVALLGDAIAVLAGTIDASGTEGGTVRIGGGISGGGNLPTAETLLVASGVSVLAEGHVGNGGSVVAFAEDTANLQGFFSAQGASQGGFVETSADFLNISKASINASGQEGGGAWLIDPVDIEIVSGATGVNQINTDSIVSSLDSGVDVLIDTSNSGSGSGDITLRNPINQTGVSSANLTLTGRRFETNGSTINLASTGQLTFNLNAVNPEATTTARSIDRAIAAIGRVNGDRLITLGAGTYEFGGIQAISTDVDIVGDRSGGTILTALNNERLFDIYSGVTTRLRDLTFTTADTPTDVPTSPTTGPTTGPTAGGLRNAGNLTIENSLFQNNKGAFGGAIQSLPNASLTVVGSRFIDNAASEEGGAISASDNVVSIVGSTFSGNTSAIIGGALSADSGTQLTISDSSFTGNSARTGGGVLVTGDSEAIITGSTFVGNAAEVRGGGLYVETGRTVDISDTTFDSNKSSEDGGGITLRGRSTTTLTNSVLINNVAGDDGGGLHHVDGGSAVLTNVRVENNAASDMGGGLYQFASADLTIVDSLVRGNQAGNEGGGLMNNAASAANTTIVRTAFEANSAETGGGLFSRTDGTVAITDSDFVDNEATQFDGGAIYAVSASALTISGGRFDSNTTLRDGGAVAVFGGDRLEIEKSTFTNNAALFDDGGGLFLQGTASATIADSLFDGNSSADDGGALSLERADVLIENSAFRFNSAADDGGAIQSFDSRLDTVGTTFTQNNAIDDGGALHITDASRATLRDSALDSNRAGDDGGGLHARTNSSVVIENSVVTGNTAATSGGGISGELLAEITLRDSVIQNNVAFVDGGGIRLTDDAIATLEQSQLSNNTARFGGGLELSQRSRATVVDTTFSANEALLFGGAVMVDDGSDLSLSGSTLSANQADGGGGIFAIGSSSLVNATLSNNVASRDGGGISLFGPSAFLSARNSTLTNNVAAGVGGGIAVGDVQATAELLNTIVAGNSAGATAIASDISGRVVDAGHNLVGIAAASAGLGASSFAGTVTDPLDPGLEALTNNGGQTETYLLSANSVAVNAGASSRLPTTDQRGFIRVAGAAVDIGAVEMAASELPPDVFNAIAPNLPIIPPTPTPTPTPPTPPEVIPPEVIPPEVVLPEVVPPEVTPTIPALTLADPPVVVTPSSPNPSDSVPTLSTNLLSSLSLDFPSPAEIDEAAIVVLPEVSRSEQTIDNKTVQKLEQTFGQSFEEYWDLSLGPDLSFDEVQAILRQAKADYGVSSAVIYAAFTPIEEAEADENNSTRNQRVLDISPEASDDDPLKLSLVMPEGELVSYQLPYTRKQVTRQAMLFRSMASDPVDDFSYQPFAYRVYEWLLAPLEEDLAKQGIQNLMYALDTGLRTAPITAMRDDSGFALERFGMSVIPNVGLMQADFGASVGRSTVAMGVAEFESQAPLPAVPVELAMVDEYMAAAQTLLNEGSTFDALESVQTLAQPGSLHLATHAYFDESSPDSSYIQLWNDPLSMTEFRQIDWQGSDLNLLILSACSTAMSSHQAELGFAGLAAASGVDATVGSLWQVSDVGTLALMSEFYAQLGSSDLRFEALRRAQLALMKGETRIENGNLINSRGEIDLPDEWDIPSEASLAHPFFWSAFTMVGNPW